MKLFTVLFFILFSVQSFSQSYEKKILRYQKKHHKKFLNPETSPLSQEQIKKFKKHDFFP